jgi:hypothetical protein
LKLPKYSIYFLVFIISLKVIYLIVEVYYNGHLIDVVTSADINVEDFENIETMGHRVSAIGITLLLTPVFYLLIKKFINLSAMLMTITTLSFMLISFLGFQALLVMAMDEIIEQNKDKRYSSYYVSAFKYGLLNQNMGYETFIPKERLKSLNIEDKIIISNMFLLTLVDKSLTDKLINSGSNIFVDMFIKQYNMNDYRESKMAFTTKAQDIVDLYNSYIDNSKKINLEFSRLYNQDLTNAQYQDFETNLRGQYKEYNNAVIKYKNSRIPSNEKVQQTKSQLDRYFKYSKIERAQRQYKESMHRNFGKYIEPERWLPKNKKNPTNDSVRNLMIEEADKKWHETTNGLPSNLSQLEFYKHPITKNKVIKELHKKGLLVNKDFNYSKQSYVDAYTKKINIELNKAKNELLNELEKQSGKRFVFGLNYNQFIEYFKKDMTKKHGNKYGSILFSMIKNQNTDNFYNNFYRPYFKEKKLSQYLLTKDELDSKEHKQKGDDAIKHLYIPPFAIGMSILAGMLNFVSLIAAFVFLLVPMTNFSMTFQIITKTTFKAIIISFLIYYPYSISQKRDVLKPYLMLNNSADTIGANYIKFISWLMVVEKYNYEVIYPKVKFLIGK